MIIKTMAEKISKKQSAISHVILGVALTFIANYMADQFKHQRETNEKLIAQSATTGAYAANAEARVERIEARFEKHVDDWVEWKRKTDTWYENPRVITPEKMRYGQSTVKAKADQ